MDETGSTALHSRGIRRVCLGVRRRQFGDESRELPQLLVGQALRRRCHRLDLPQLFPEHVKLNEQEIHRLRAERGHCGRFRSTAFAVAGQTWRDPFLEAGGESGSDHAAQQHQCENNHAHARTLSDDCIRENEVERGAPDLMRCQRVETRGVPYVTR